MAKEHTREGRFRRDVGGIVALGVIGGYFASPLLRLCDAAFLAMGGASLGVLALLLYGHVVLNERTRLRVALPLLLFASACLFGSLGGGMWQSNRLDRECGTLQAVMLHGRAAGAPAPRPGQASAVDAFQALGCRPQF